MANILLINPSYLRTYGTNQAGIANPVYPILSLAVLAANARQSGHRASILDLSYRAYDPNFIKEIIMREKPDVVGITATTPLANQMRDISFLVKEVSKEIITVGGGAHPSALRYETMNESILDVVAFGEADLTVVDILNAKRFSEIDGICWRNGETVVMNHPRGLIGDLDELPMPAWDLYPIDEYRNRVTKIITRYPPLTTIEFSRGCVFKCDFCGSKNTMGLGYRKKSPKRCADELEYLEKLGYREALLTDDIFTSDNHWAIQVCEAITRRNLKIKWTCTNGIRVDSANDKLFKAMKRAGCYRVHFGFESGNDSVLQSFGKGGRASLEQGLVAVQSARKAGLETWGMFLLGLYYDTKETMEDTIRYAKKVKTNIKKLGIVVPFPGTPMFNQLRKDCKIKTYNWDDYNLYNDSNAIFDHPRLQWETIQKYYKRAYLELYYKDPLFILRRFWRGILTLEIFFDLMCAVKFFFLLRKKATVPEEENYAFGGKWKLLNTQPDEMVEYSYPKARKQFSPPVGV